MDDVVELSEAQIGCDFQEYRRVAGVLADALARIDDFCQEIVERCGLLQIAQARRVGRGHVDGEIARYRRKGLDQFDVIGDAVGGILVRADIDAEDTAKMRAPGQPPQHGFGAIIVEAHAVDHGLVALEPEQPRPRIADLRLRCHGADLDKAETEPEQRIRRLRALIEAGRHADRIGEIQPERPHRQFRIVRPRPYRRQQFQALDRQTMGVFRIEPAQQRQREGIEGADHGSSSGMSCVPSARARMSYTPKTAPRSSSP